MVSRLVRREKISQLLRTGRPTPDPRSRLILAAQFTKYILLGAALAAFEWTLDQRFLSWDPLSFLFALPPHSWLLYLAWAAAIGLPSLVLYRPWCRFLCPLGALLMLLGKFAFLDAFSRSQTARL
jgi:polyferredoxin